MYLRLTLLAALFLLVCPATLLADTYQYTFTGTSYIDADFTFSTDALITTATTVTPTSCSYNLGSGTIDCDSIQADSFGDNLWYLQPTEPWEDAFDFEDGLSLTDIGTQTDFVGDTLTITDIPSPAAAPEPSSIALLGIALLSFAGITRRRWLAQSQATFN
ncbi:MAG TPA: PEP-CTERM sorting domain-containing protein [Acidobacteriaceae bacterium]|jgi:hypothetical protein|nr:PEP-CTERM sorting domain-containing protein [Acidobacteriaceae bacterium]